jgi:hypothetical protein
MADQRSLTSSNGSRLAAELRSQTRWAVATFSVVAIGGCIAVHAVPLTIDYLQAARHSVMVSVAVAAAWRLMVLLDVALAALWLVLYARDRWSYVDADKTTLATDGHLRTVARILSSLVVQGNRHSENIWSFLTSMVLALFITSSLYACVLLLCLLFFLVPVAASWLGLTLARQAQGKEDFEDVTTADLLWLRRPVFLVATLVALAFLLPFGGAWHHSPVLWMAIFVAMATILRLLQWIAWFCQWSNVIEGRFMRAMLWTARLLYLSPVPAAEQDRAEISTSRGRVLKAFGVMRARKNTKSLQEGNLWHRSAIEKNAALQEVIVLAGLAGIVVLGPLAPIFSEGEMQEMGMAQRVGHWRQLSVGQALPYESGPWDVALFLVADNQFRALDGNPSMGHSSLIDRLVPVAVRPVELDLLSGATLDHFARVFNKAKQNPQFYELRWAHLGDFSDLACRSEMNRIEDVVRSFGQASSPWAASLFTSLAGFAPGNHDSFFTGNFAWHPDWSRKVSCPGEARAGGPQRRGGRAGTNARMKGLEAQSAVVISDPIADGFLASIVKLSADSPLAPVYGLFLDTVDYDTYFWLGAAGAVGTISDKQASWVVEQLDKLPTSARVVILQHHPYESLARLSRWRYARIADAIEAHDGNRVLAVVSAHTHHSELRWIPLRSRGGRYFMVPEFIVGSTTDPPPEAAVLLLKPTTSKAYHLTFSTLPAVVRSPEQPFLLQGLDTIQAATCLKHMDSMREHCPALFHSPVTPSDDDQRSLRAKAVVDCMHVTPVPGKDALRSPDIYARIAETCSSAGGKCEEQLVCLAWAASVFQGHKHDGWTLGAALDLAFQELATYGVWSETAEVPSPLL